MESGNSISRSPSPTSLLSQTELCVVCGDAADGFHYGVRSCRGCNAFFRRAVTFNMQFTCRRGGKCPVDKNARCACRACRLSKCYSVGMDRKAVQPKREGQAAVISTGKGDYRPPSEHATPNLMSPTDINHASAFTPINNQLTTEMFIPALSPSPPPNTGLITRQCYEFSEQKRRRRMMLCNSLEEILSDDCESALRNIATADDYSRLFQVQMVLMFEWVEKLPEFRMLDDPMDKTRLLRAFALRYILLDNVFHTVEMGYTDRYVLVNNNYIIPGYPPPASSALLLDERKVYMLMFGSEAQELINELINPITEMRLTVGEMMALRSIMFWNPGDIGLTPSGLTLSQEASNVVVKELHKYFENEEIMDIEARIGNMLLLLPAFTKHVRVLLETVKLIPSFGKMQEWDSFMDDLVGGI